MCIRAVWVSNPWAPFSKGGTRGRFATLCASREALGPANQCALRLRLDGSEPEVENETKMALTRKEASTLHKAMIT
jgi:hypothetical protein